MEVNEKLNKKDLKEIKVVDWLANELEAHGSASDAVRENARLLSNGEITPEEAEARNERAYHAKAYQTALKGYQKLKDSGKLADTISGRGVTAFAADKLTAGVADELKRIIAPDSIRVRLSYAETAEQIIRAYTENQEEKLTDEDYSQAAVHLVLIMITALLNACPEETNAKTVYRAVANDIKEDYKWQMATKDKDKKQVQEAEKYINQRVGQKERRMAAHSMAARLNGGEPIEFNLNTEDLMCVVVRLTGVVVASGLFIQGKTEDKTRQDTLCMSPELALHCQKQEVRKALRTYKYIPTVCPPLKWTGINSGGYYGDMARGMAFIRRRPSFGGVADVYREQYEAKLATMDLTNVYNVVNAIQETPYKINLKVLEVLEWALKKTESDPERGYYADGIAGVEPTVIAPPVCPENPDEEQLKQYKIASKWYNEKGLKASQSKRLRTSNIIDIAQDFKAYDKIYFVHNLDFRGRVYPVGTFTPQGDDVSRGLLLYAEAPAISKEQAEAALDWLYITLANLGAFKVIVDGQKVKMDSRPYNERIQWTKENRQNIEDCANDPYNNMMWADADCPWQFLSACYEFKNAMEYLEKNGSLEGFSTGLVVAMDATFSGMQHFTAILKDETVAPLVNLTDTDKKNDCYGVVAGLTNEQIMKDLISGSSDEVDERITERDDGTKTIEQWTLLGTKSLAAMWMAWAKQTYGEQQQGITRKEAKRNTMTTAYGSGQYGYAEQDLEIIKGQQQEHFTKTRGKTPYIMATKQKQCANYLAGLNAVSIGKVLSAPIECMEWLKTIAKLVTANGQVVSWVTPFGLPVQQAYMAYDFNIITCQVQGKRVRIYNPEATGEIDKHRQVSAIAPNFVHSLDASHLMFTVQAMAEHGIRHFSMIHDSFGTTLADAQTMYDLIRQTFHELYSGENPIVDFYNQMLDLIKYNSLVREYQQQEEQTGKRRSRKGKKLPKHLQHEPVQDMLKRLGGSYNIDECLKSKYMFC